MHDTFVIPASAVSTWSTENKYAKKMKLTTTLLIILQGKLNSAAVAAPFLGKLSVPTVEAFFMKRVTNMILVLQKGNLIYSLQ